MDWADSHSDKLTTAADAASRIRSGESLYMGMLTNHPYEFEQALAARASELEDVRVHHYLSLFPWEVLAEPESLRHFTLFATQVDRTGIAEGRTEYVPWGSWAAEHLAADLAPPDTAVVSLSPPDRDGNMSFGSCLWLNRDFCRRAGRIFAEVDPGFIRTAGDNRIHVSEIKAMWVREPSQRAADPPPLGEEMAAAADTICRFIVDELIADGDCLQIGTGDATRRLADYLGDKRDIGIQTEMIPGGVMQMLDRGVITGARKRIGTGKVVGAALVAPRDEIAMANEHPGLELWDFTRTDDLRILTQLDNFRAINNAVEVDVTGQVSAEGIGPRVYSGPGGQPVFAIAASYSPGGASIVVVPSSLVVDGRRRSRIVAAFRPGTSVTVPRSFVDYVVTEYGIAKLSGKTQRERARSLVAIAHPELREEISREAKDIYGL